MIGIYKITNLINGKVYIGQSIHIERRWKEHCSPSANSLISSAIKKYGKDNFLFEVVEECSSKELNEKEEYYIHFFNSIVPNGYNVTDVTNGNSTTYIYFSKEDLLDIIDKIKNTNMSFQEIANIHNLSTRTIYHINKGDIHKLENENYPLREVKDFSKKYTYCIDCGTEISKGCKRCLDCYKKSRLANLPEREVLKDMIRNRTFVSIGKDYGVDGNAVKKWCIKYNLPSKKKDIVLYSDEEWKLI